MEMVEKRCFEFTFNKFCGIICYVNLVNDKTGGVEVCYILLCVMMT